MRRSAPAPPAPLLVAIESAVMSIDGADRFVRRGERLRPDDPAVLVSPSLFLEDGLADSEYGAARLRLFPLVRDDEAS
jgi:hypothetical protein